MKTAIATLVALAGAAQSQVVINEVAQNPEGPAAANDSVLEFIEFYGEPNMSLDGYAVGLVNGGSDPDGNDTPNTFPEIDEAFSLTGLSLDANGFLVLYNGTPQDSLIPLLFLFPGAASASFFDQHIPAPDTNGNLENDGSSTYLLVRARPGYSLVGGVDTYDPSDYNFAKDTAHDIDFDGKLDFGDETPGLFAPNPVAVEPLQIIDEIAWSNAGGKEYVSSSQFEISDTPGFNPDAISRLEYFIENPMAGVRLNSEGETVPTRIADESWVYGEITSAFEYDASVGIGGPTDPNGDGFQDIFLDQFPVTPGTFNDSSSLSLAQFRFVRGDFNRDGMVDFADFLIITEAVGENLDITVPCVDDEGMPIVIDGTQPDCYVYQGRDANALLAMMNIDKTDGPAGANDPSVTQADVDQFVLEFGPFACNDADLALPFGILDLADIDAFILAFLSGGAAADIAPPFGVVDLGDIDAFILDFFGGCP
ncbi:MAG: hypothetical protein AAGI53_03250 [Planctomycetota bacterium]